MKLKTEHINKINKIREELKSKSTITVKDGNTTRQYIDIKEVERIIDDNFNTYFQLYDINNKIGFPG